MNRSQVTWKHDHLHAAAERLGPGRKLALVLLSFLLIYNIAPAANESVTSGRVAALVLVTWLVLEGQLSKLIPRTGAWILFLPAPYAFLQYLVVGDFGQFSRFMHLALYSFLGASALACLSRNLQNALTIILQALLIQTAFIFFSFFSIEYRLWFDQHFTTGANFDPTYLYRAPGLSGVPGSALSVVQSLGVFCGWLLLAMEKRVGMGIASRRTLIISSMVLCAISCIFVGRLGLILSGLFFLLAVLSKKIKNREIMALTGLLVIFGVLCVQFFGALVGDGFSIDYFVQWAFGFLSGKDHTASTLIEMNVPPLSIETLYGTGLVSLTATGHNPSGNDSGFIQAYYSLGLMFSSLLYATYAIVLWSLVRWAPFFWRIMICATFFLVEFKEPFMFKYTIVLILMVLFVAKRERTSLL